MIELIEYLVEEFIGRQYTALVKFMMQGEKTMAELADSSLISYESLTDQLKYLIRQDIVTLNKRGERLTYAVVPEAVFYFQRPAKYNRYLINNFNKEECMILQHLLTNRASLIEHTIKTLVTRKNGKLPNYADEERFRKTFSDLIKTNVVFEDERAADMHV
jgi:hypothetical protein